MAAPSGTPLLRLVVLMVVLALGSAVDMTRQEKQTGSEVVQAVVDRIRDGCIFPHDRLFLGRLAYVVSQDGKDPKTYRSGYYGGIWQIDENTFKTTQLCPPNILHICNQISQFLHIDWKHVQWRDLLKPLYSGLAAALFIQLRQGETIPGDLDAQSLIWQHLYHPKPPVANFSALVQTNSGCDREIDLAFIVDSSGSIDVSDFNKMLVFLGKIVRGLHVSRDGTHVAVVRFSSLPELQFRLDDNFTASEIIARMQRIQYDAGSTDTASAIEMVTNSVFSQPAGARKDAAKVAVLLTDGGSDDKILTLKAAQKAKDEGIVFLTIGIGSIYPLELESIATAPNCTHYFLLNDFTEIGSMLYQIQNSACRAQVSYALNASTTHVTNGKIPQNTTIVVKIDKTPPISGHNSTENDTFISILTTVSCGVVYVYASYDITHPGPAFHDLKGVATGDLPSVLYVNTSMDGRPLYVAYAGKNLPSSTGELNNCTYSSKVKHGKPDGAHVVCRDKNGERACTLTDFVTSPYYKFLCRNDWHEVSNPCTHSAVSEHKLYHPHPYDNTKFIKCDLKGDMYITQCPGNKRYVQESHVCGTEHASVDSNKKPLTSITIVNPCTLDHIRANKLYFPYPGDPAKYIHCDVSGDPWEASCQDGYLWFQDAQTCSPDYQHQHVGTTPSAFTNPCTPTNIAAGKVLFLYPADRNKYVQCDVATGIYYIRSCPHFMHFDLGKNYCVRRNE